VHERLCAQERNLDASGCLQAVGTKGVCEVPRVHGSCSTRKPRRVVVECVQARAQLGFVLVQEGFLVSPPPTRMVGFD
jgi:hypothetical protein